ncbi:MAG TPA: phosphatase PAP2 family protein [Thermoanaerobaculia bacterium]|nr:phosphatase PAP2 family protein [Thermoanaerobaculia bacterium]
MATKTRTPVEKSPMTAKRSSSRAVATAAPLVNCRRGQPMLSPQCEEQRLPSAQRPPANPTAPYDLDGAQVEPEAGWWSLRGKKPLPHVVEIGDVRDLVEKEASPFYVPPFPTTREFLEWEIRELVALARARDRAAATSGTFSEAPPANDLPAAFTDTTRDPISDFAHLDPPPFGAIFNIGSRRQLVIDNINQQHLRRRRDGTGRIPPVVTTGRQLARLFESETPGLVHRNALNYLLFNRPEISPPRQARIWMALDVAIYSALNAAWHYKWADTKGRAYRQRPYEYDRDRTFRVLFDDQVDDCGELNQCARRTPCPSPGTPRHPAYPSGHSTFSAAASRLLAYFFPDEEAQLMRLANNIGTARLWAGVHWRTDHVAGQRIGFAVAELVIQQLRDDCISSLQQNIDEPEEVPDQAQLARRAKARRKGEDCVPEHDELPTQRPDAFPPCPADRKYQVF